MNTKQLFLAGAFLLAGTTYAQQIQTVNTTGLGTDNGARNFNTFSSGNNGTHIGANAGYFADMAGVGGNTFIGSQAGRGDVTIAKNTGSLNTFTGFEAGKTITSGSGNTFIGAKSGDKNTTGSSNVFVGEEAGSSNISGSFKICVGQFAGSGNNSDANIFIGHGAGAGNTSGYSNTAMGHLAGYNGTGSNNVFLGQGAGQASVGSGNVFVGVGAGYGLSTDNKLIVATSATPLIYGDFSNGKISIGGSTSFPATAGSVSVSNYKLFVKGGILTEEARVQLQSGWADYVFAKGYKLAPLAEVEQFIAINGHLPKVPSAAQVKAEGIELGNMARIQQEKIEELTLYAIEQDKKLEQQQKEIDELKAAVKLLTAERK